MGGLYLSRNEKKAAFSFCSRLTIYNGQVIWRKELKKKKRQFTCYWQWRKIRQIRQMYEGYMNGTPWHGNWILVGVRVWPHTLNSMHLQSTLMPCCILQCIVYQTPLVVWCCTASCIHAPACATSLIVCPCFLVSCVTCLVCLFPLSDCFHCW